MSNRLKFYLKLSVSLTLFIYLLTTLELNKLTDDIRRISFIQILFAVFFFQISKILAALRFSQLFRKRPSFLELVAIIYRAGFFGLFLPGGLGADAYRSKILYEKEKISISYALRLITFERLSGLIQLVSIIAFAAIFLQPLKFKAVMVSVFIICFFIYVVIAKRFINFDYLRILRIDVYSVGLQFSQCICYGILIGSLDLTQLPGVFVLFGLSSIASMIPISFSGIGSRESVFYSLGFISGLELSELIKASILFTLISLISSLMGALVINRNPEQN